MRNPIAVGVAYLLVLLFLAAPSRGAAPEGQALTSRLSALVARPNGLSSDLVAGRATATSFTLRQRREEVAAAIAGVNQAIVALMPRLTLLARYVRLSDVGPSNLGNVAVPPPMLPQGPIPTGTPLFNVPIELPVILNQTTLQATLAVPISDYLLRLPMLHAAARATRDAARATEAATRLQVATDGRVAYYGWARARLSGVVAEAAVTQAKAHREVARRLFDAGVVSKADTMRVEAQLAASELFLERARDLEVVLAEQLRIAMHDEQKAGYEIGEDLQAELPPLAEEPLASLADEAWAHRLEPAALRDAVRAQRAQTNVVRGAALPQLAAFGDLVDANPNPRFFPYRDAYDFTWDVGVQLSWTPNESALNGLGAAGAAARARALDAQLGALRDAVRFEVVQLYEAAREADFAVQSTRRGLEAAEESYRVRRELFQHGRSTSFEMTDAETDVTQARLGALGARIDQRITRARLQHALGRDVDRVDPSR